MKPVIPNPCTEKWDRMAPAAEGRFCDACSKTVIDFTQYTDEQLRTYFEQYSSTKVCGRFRTSQLSNAEVITISYRELQGLGSQRLFLVLLFVVFGASLFSCTDHNGKYTQPKAQIEQPMSRTLGEPMMPPPDTVIDENALRMPEVQIKPGKGSLPKVVIQEELTGEVVMGKIKPQPMFPGGEEAMQRFVHDNLVYPKADPIHEGKVIAAFAVKPDGHIGKMRIVKALAPEYDQAVLDLIGRMPAWVVPENQDTTETEIVLPVRFSK